MQTEDQAAEPTAGADEVATVRLDDITLDERCQSRSTVSEQQIRRYAELYADDPAALPPIELVTDGQDYWPADGWHRIAGRRLAGYHDIPARVRQGTVEDAAWVSFSANAAHGLNRTNTDKWRACTAALLHPRGQKLSDRQIAKHVGVSRPFVGKVRAKLIAGGRLEEPTTVIGADGKVQPYKRSRGAAPTVSAAFPEGCTSGDERADHVRTLFTEAELVAALATPGLQSKPRSAAEQQLERVRMILASPDQASLCSLIRRFCYDDRWLRLCADRAEALAGEYTPIDPDLTDAKQIAAAKQLDTERIALAAAFQPGLCRPARVQAMVSWEQLRSLEAYFSFSERYSPGVRRALQKLKDAAAEKQATEKEARAKQERWLERQLRMSPAAAALLVDEQDSGSVVVWLDGECAAPHEHYLAEGRAGLRQLLADRARHLGVKVDDCPLCEASFIVRTDGYEYCRHCRNTPAGALRAKREQDRREQLVGEQFSLHALAERAEHGLTRAVLGVPTRDGCPAPGALQGVLDLKADLVTPEALAEALAFGRAAGWLDEDLRPLGELLLKIRPPAPEVTTVATLAGRAQYQLTRYVMALPEDDGDADTAAIAEEVQRLRVFDGPVAGELHTVTPAALAEVLAFGRARGWSEVAMAPLLDEQDRLEEIDRRERARAQAEKRAAEAETEAAEALASHTFEDLLRRRCQHGLADWLLREKPPEIKLREELATNTISREALEEAIQVCRLAGLPGGHELACRRRLAELAEERAIVWDADEPTAEQVLSAVNVLDALHEHYTGIPLGMVPPLLRMALTEWMSQGALVPLAVVL